MTDKRTYAKQSTISKMSLNSMSPQQQAKAFRTAFRVRNSTTPASRAKQRKLVVEEFKEFLEAEQQLIIGFKQNSVDTLKELADLVYVCYQYAENLGWNLDEALQRVHDSNMTKLDERGDPIYREDGKVLKGPNYKEPTLTDLV
jgi:predicted HAD superfamily Cof-like phosphohydrolase